MNQYFLNTAPDFFSQSPLSPPPLQTASLPNNNAMTASTPNLNFRYVQPDAGPSSHQRGSFSTLPLPKSFPSFIRSRMLSRSELENMVEQLQMAIAHGDIEKAKACASDLASQSVKINMGLEEDTIAHAVESDFRLKVYVEYKNLSAGYVYLNINPSMTIKRMKEKMMIQHKIHSKLQKWIIGNRLCSDDEILSELGCKKDKTVFLYIMTAKFAGLEKGRAEDDCRRLSLGMPTQFEEINKEDNGFVIVQRQDIPQAAQPAFPLQPIVETIAEPKEKRREELRWQCPQCTYLNIPTRPGCEMCGAGRPENFLIPDDYELTPAEKTRKENDRLLDIQTEQAELERQHEALIRRETNYHFLVEQDQQLDLVANEEDFICSICYDTVEQGEGVVLRECLHMFCRSCLEGTILNSEEAQVLCPFNDGSYTCEQPLQHREVQGLVDHDGFEKYLQRGLATAEGLAANSYHCKTNDCQGWCLYEDAVNVFKCPVCDKKNCLTCKAIHEGQNCKEYQDDLRNQANNNVAAKQTQEMLTKMLSNGGAMKCPGCQIIVQKKEGCDWLRCTMCKTEICWCTRGPRWGSLGNGDISGGCKCRVNGVICHPNCQNCH